MIYVGEHQHSRLACVRHAPHVTHALCAQDNTSRRPPAYRKRTADLCGTYLYSSNLLLWSGLNGGLISRREPSSTVRPERATYEGRRFARLKADYQRTPMQSRSTVKNVRITVQDCRLRSQIVCGIQKPRQPLQNRL